MSTGKQTIKIILLLLVLLSSCIKIVSREYVYIYKIESSSYKISFKYRLPNGLYKTDTLYNVANPALRNWQYWWYSTSRDDKYSISLKNETPEGHFKVMIIRNQDTLREEVGLNQLTISKL